MGTGLKERLLEMPLAYRLWQAPFVEKKLRPLRAHNDMAAVRRVLDIGCGPGTNTAHFAGADYLGIDVNPRYIAAARRRTGRDFLVQDATTYRVEGEGRFDFILLNSFLHHVGDGEAAALLEHAATLLAPGGHVHILDLVLPARPGPARLLARLDRGRHPRPLAAWRELFHRPFAEAAFVPYSLTLLGIPLWRMVYFKGKARHEQ